VWDDGVQRKVKIGEVNPALAKLDNKDTVRYLDLGSQFLEPDGKIPDDVFPDQLHPSAKGYEIWAKAMQPLLDEMMASEPKPSQ
jgi:lysophospholipase L1-like esterase